MMAAIAITPGSPADEMFTCARGGGNGPPCKLLKRACIERQQKKWERKGGSQGKKWKRAFAAFSFCASGRCEQGVAIAAEVGDLSGAPARPRASFGTIPALLKPDRPRRPISPARDANPDNGEDNSVSPIEGKPAPVQGKGVDTSADISPPTPPPQAKAEKHAEAPMTHGAASAAAGRTAPNEEDALRMALRGLGFRAAEVDRVTPHTKGGTLEEKVKNALSLLRGGAPVPEQRLCRFCPSPIQPTRNKSGICGDCQTKGFRADGRVPRGDGTRGPLPGHGRTNPAKIRESVLSDRLCRCGCGRRLAHWNQSGYAGVCNQGKYAGGQRAPRASLPPPGNVRWEAVADDILTSTIEAAATELRRRIQEANERRARLTSVLEKAEARST